MLYQFKNILLRHIKNSFGWSTSRKIVVFSADDYGSVRLASREAREKLKASGLIMNGNKFDRYDSLEDANDLSQLFEALDLVKDSQNRSAVFTAMSLPANPDFETMIETGYSEYKYELVSDTWKKIPGYHGVDQLWKEGIEKRLIFPQFHGREHINVKVLMEALKTGDKQAIECFNNRSYCGILKKIYPTINYVAAFDFDRFEENESLKQVVTEGLDAFEKVFGFRASHFAAPGAREHSCLSETLSKGGIRYLDSDMIRREHQGNGKFRKSIDYTGKRNKSNQIFLVRNVVFEPDTSNNIAWVDYCMLQIDIAFRWHKPANISTHRVNFAGHIEPGNRETGLKLLKELLGRIVKKWPDVEFMTTVELGELIEKTSESI